MGQTIQDGRVIYIVQPICDAKRALYILKTCMESEGTAPENIDRMVLAQTYLNNAIRELTNVGE